MENERQREADAARTRELVAAIAEFDAAEARIQAERARLYAEAFDLTQQQTARLRDATTREREMPLRAMAAELAVAKRVSDRTMQTHLFDAHRTVNDFAATWQAWRDGRVSRAHVGVIVDNGLDLTDTDTRAAYEHEALAYAETTSASRLRPFAEQAAEKHNPKSMQERHDVAVLQRRVWVEDLRDGMSMLGAIGPAVEIHGVYDRLTRQGKAIKHADRAARRDAAERDAAERDAQREGTGLPSGGGGGGGGGDGDGGGLPAGERGEVAHEVSRRDGQDSLEAPTDAGASFGMNAAGDDPGSVGAGSDLWFDQRSLDQIRTDLLFDMMLTSTPSVDTTGGVVEGGLGAIRAHVQVTVPATTLAGTTTGGAELDGKCAVDPETAKILAGNAPGFDRVFLDPIGGAVLAVDRRHASAAQKRYLMARDVRCRFPGCRRPARDCEWDHREDYALGGKTDIENLGAFCKRHHTLKHAAGWTVIQHPGGRLQFTAPSGLEYTDGPPPRVMFTPDLPPGGAPEAHERARAPF
ncbi:HNH endonuclease signature motif containing protein [Microbacterium aquimaris]|uniref:DUF222 domain-containing protein n=1 Tax=Microbacterium aquimaris TaxID=459816 RepID=A0ABU5N576_9MICO|nr:HNH endonuclease signature motif containing protein [Microbacterium aquimaris]MDZ8161242.1 DUF222 domain-containing protein [Microbacterium aquimaris]